MKAERLLKGGTILTPRGRFRAGIAIAGGKIAAVAEEALLPPSGEVVDISGAFLIPGIIDCHCHFRDMGLSYKGDFETETKAAAAGGVTFGMDMPNTVPPTTTAARFREKREVAERKSVIDFNLIAGATQDEEELRLMAQEGTMGFKVFMYRWRARAEEEGDAVLGELFFTEDAELLDIFGKVKKTGLPLLIHIHSQSILESQQERLRGEGRRDVFSFMEPWISPEMRLGMRLAGQRVLAFARHTGVRLHICHGFLEVLDLVEAAKARGLPVTTCGGHIPIEYPQDLERLKALVLQYPRPREEIEEKLRALATGRIDCLAPDHSPHTREEKERALKEDVWLTPTGMPKLQDHLPLLLTEVNNGKITLERLVELGAENPARIFGLFPRKGTIQAGSDADLVVVDMEREKVITQEEQFSRAGYTPYEGRKVKGLPVMTFVRGEVVMREGEILVEPGYGRFYGPLGHAWV